MNLEYGTSQVNEIITYNKGNRQNSPTGSNAKLYMIGYSRNNNYYYLTANNNGIGGKMFHEVTSTIIHHDPYMVLADFEDYRNTQLRISKDFLFKISFANAHQISSL